MAGIEIIQGEVKHLGELNEAVGELLSGFPMQDRIYQLPIGAVSYYLAEDSKVRKSPTYKMFARDFTMLEDRPFGVAPVKGVLHVPERTSALYTAMLDLREIQEYLTDYRFSAGRVVDMKSIVAPEALKPNQQIIIGCNDPRTVLYTIDYEGSNWSLHINKPQER